MKTKAKEKNQEQNTDPALAGKQTSGDQVQSGDLLRIWQAAVSRADPGSPFKKFFARVIFVNNHFNEAQTILLLPCCCFNGLD